MSLVPTPQKPSSINCSVICLTQLQFFFQGLSDLLVLVITSSLKSSLSSPSPSSSQAPPTLSSFLLHGLPFPGLPQNCEMLQGFFLSAPTHMLMALRSGPPALTFPLNVRVTSTGTWTEQAHIQNSPSHYSLKPTPPGGSTPIGGSPSHPTSGWHWKSPSLFLVTWCLPVQPPLLLLPAWTGPDLPPLCPCSLTAIVPFLYVRFCFSAASSRTFHDLPSHT